MWLWSLTGYSSGCLYSCVYSDLLDSFSLLGWLEWSRNSQLKKGVHEHWQEDMPSYLVKKKEWFVIYLFIFYFSKARRETLALAPGYQKVTHRETRLNIYHWFQWEYKFFMRAKGQQQKYLSAPLHFDIELYSSSCQNRKMVFDCFTTAENITVRLQ